MARVTDISTQEFDERIVDDTASWLVSEDVEPLIRGALADAALLAELEALLPDTIDEL